MADISLGYSSWTIVSLFVGFLALLPTIMGLFSKNKFNVNGKVRSAIPNCSARLTGSPDSPAPRSLGGNGKERGESIGTQRREHHHSIAQRHEARSRIGRSKGPIPPLPFINTLPNTCSRLQQQIPPPNASPTSPPTSLTQPVRPASSLKPPPGTMARPPTLSGA